MRLAGAGVASVAAWLLAFDVARETARGRGLPRFAAWCLLPGHAWLGAGGLVLALAPDPLSGPAYGAGLHAVFLGFVFSMVFAHAPVILPAVLGVGVPYRPRYHAHLALLHLSLLARVAGDAAGWPDLRAWGGGAGAAAVLLFVLSTALAAAGNPAARGR